MISSLSAIWEDFFLPMLQRPRRLQVAALCHREFRNQTEVLLVTSRDTGRWIIPKGWPIRGLKSSEAAAQEAWEEAGVKDGKAAPQSIGTYTYDKTMASGLPVPVETLVYSVAVENLEDEFPEANQRERKWVSPNDAANMIQETDLKSILRHM